MTQLTDKIREALLGNVGTIICGRVGVTDADLMVKAFSPTFTAEDLTKTPNHAAICKVMMFGMPSAPFTMNLPAPMGEPNIELMNTLKVYSATKFGKTRAEVEQEIEARWSAAEKAKGGEIGALDDVQGTQAPKPLTDTSPVPNPAPAASQAPQAGFLDNWLSQNK